MCRRRFLPGAMVAAMCLAATVASAEEPESVLAESRPAESATESGDERASGGDRIKLFDDSAHGALSEIVVEAKKPMSAASSDEIRARDFDLRPHSTLIEILNNVPGLVVAQHQGGAKAAQYLIRGFDSDHGTDFALYVDGTPVNLVSHAHGQGYADLNFVIPETGRTAHGRRVLLASIGTMAHDRAVAILARGLTDAGFHVTQAEPSADVAATIAAAPSDGAIVGISVRGPQGLAALPSLLAATGRGASTARYLFVGGDFTADDGARIAAQHRVRVFARDATTREVVDWLLEDR